MLTLTGRTAVVTGGSRNIGYAISRKFAENGMNSFRQPIGRFRKPSKNCLHFDFSHISPENLLLQEIPTGPQVYGVFTLRYLKSPNTFRLIKGVQPGSMKD